MAYMMQIDSDKYDEAMLRLACASSLLTLIGAQFDQESCSYSNIVISESLYGVGLLLDDAGKHLN
jgi:hypothetical protein